MTHDLTDAQRRYQSMTAQERAAYSAANQERRNQYQRRTLEGAVNMNLPWSANEDNVLVWSHKRTVDLALELGRTYEQCNSRRASLRRQLTGEARHYVKIEDAIDLEKAAKTLCACATFDDDHESWCPNA